MTGSETPAARHRRVAAGFTAAVESVTDWDAPSPVDGWVARDVVVHLTTWLPDFLENNLGSTFAHRVSPERNPAEAWEFQTNAVQQMLDDPTVANTEVTSAHLGRMTVASCLDMIYTPDVFMHSWDLGRSAGIDCTLDPAYCSQLLAGIQQMDQAMRDSGHYGPKTSVPDTADAQTKLLAFIGRDPEWTKRAA